MTKATVDDLTVSRDSSGELIAEAGELKDITDDNGEPKTGEAIPMVYGDVMEHFGSSDSVEDIDADVIAALINDFVVDPDLSEHPSVEDGEITGEFVNKQLPPLVPRSLLLMVFEISGLNADVEMQDDGSAEVDFESGNEN